MKLLLRIKQQNSIDADERSANEKQVSASRQEQAVCQVMKNVSESSRGSLMMKRPYSPANEGHRGQHSDADRRMRYATIAKPGHRTEGLKWEQEGQDIIKIESGREPGHV